MAASLSLLHQARQTPTARDMWIDSARMEHADVCLLLVIYNCSLRRRCSNPSQHSGHGCRVSMGWPEGQ